VSAAGTHRTSSRAQERIPRLALSVSEAAEALGVSVDFFAEHVQPELRLVRRGRKKLIATTELSRWLNESAARVLEEPLR
jgi:excisionase family DNA binding protein